MVFAVAAGEVTRYERGVGISSTDDSDTENWNYPPLAWQKARE